MYMSENKIALRQSYFLYEFFLHNSTISSSIIGSPNLSVISLIIRNFSHISSDDWIFRQLADIDNRNNIPDTSPQSDFNEADYDDYLKEKWNRGL